MPTDDPNSTPPIYHLGSPRLRNPFWPIDSDHACKLTTLIPDDVRLYIKSIHLDNGCNDHFLAIFVDYFVRALRAHGCASYLDKDRLYAVLYHCAGYTVPELQRDAACPACRAQSARDDERATPSLRRGAKADAAGAADASGKGAKGRGSRRADTTSEAGGNA